VRICYLADAGSIHTQRWVRYFADNGHKVHLISTRPFDDNKVENVKLYVLKKFRPQIRIISFLINLLSDVIQVRKLMKKIKPDILHAHYITDCGLLGALSGFHPFVLTAWGSDVLIDPERYTFLKPLTKYVLKKADLITCDGENIIGKMGKLGANPQKIRIIYFGIDTQKFRPLPANRSLRKKELGLFDSPTIISIRALKPIYDIETLIKAIPSVLEKVPEAKFIIAGDGDQRDYLKNLATSLGVSCSIKFVGLIAHDELPRYLASADVYVSTSLSDTISVSMLEAMACELPVVVTDSGDNRKWIEDGENGFIVPIRDPSGLAEKIVFLLQNPDIRKRFGGVNRNIVGEKANYEKEMRKMEKLYEELIER